MDEIPKVAVLLETSRGYGRQLLAGILRYRRLHRPWSLVVSPGHFAQHVPQLQNERLSGAITRLTPALTRMIHEQKLPVITMEAFSEEFAKVHRRLGLCEIHSDSVAIGRMAAEHFLDRGFRHFAYCGISHDCLWSDVRQKGFAKRVEESGYSCHVYPIARSETYGHWDHNVPVLAKWLAGLPKPLGLMVANDDRSLTALHACRIAGLQVPEEVAVVGVDDDELVCELCDPPLSSVATDLESAGYDAAELLDHMMAGRVSGFHQIIVKPLWVTTRRSSDVIAQDDRLVAGMLRFIRDHAGRPIGVRDVVEHCELSRRTLERRFSEAMGHSILDEITRQRLERAKRLLLETRLAMHRVALAAGFSNEKSMHRAFRQIIGCSPWRYRQDEHGGGRVKPVASASAQDTPTSR